MFIGHVSDMRNRMQQNDALRRSKRKAANQKKSLSFGSHQQSVTPSETVTKKESTAFEQPNKWSKKEKLFLLLFLFVLLFFCVLLFFSNLR